MQKPKHNHLSDKAVVQFGQRPGPSLECDDIIYYKVTYYSKVPSPNRILYMEGLTGYTTHKPYADLCAAVPGKVDSPYTNLEPWTVEKVKVKDIREYVQSCDEFNSTQIVSPFYEFSWNSVDGGWRGLVEQPSRPGTITANLQTAYNRHRAEGQRPIHDVDQRTRAERLKDDRKAADSAADIFQTKSLCEQQ